MRYKSELYKKEQEELCDKIINILELDEKNSTILYEIDHSDKADKIMKLLPDLRKYFTFKNIIGIEDPEKAKRAWLSIMKQVTKLKYEILICDHRIKENNKTIRTKRYYFINKATDS